MNCGSVVAPTLTLDHALPPASDDDDDAGPPMVGSTTTGDKWGCVCEMTGGDAGAKWGRARHGPPRVVVAAVIVAAVSWRDGSAKWNEARRGCGGGVGLLLSFGCGAARARTMTSMHRSAAVKQRQAVAVDEMGERVSGKV